jgi:uncharacterized membrane protein YkoI
MARPKFLLLGILMSTIAISIIGFTCIQHVSGQIQDNPAMQTIGNQSKTLSVVNWTGSVPLRPLLTSIIESKTNTSLSKAADNAEKAVGINAHALEAKIGVERGYLVYTIGVEFKDNLYKVLVDAGNGKVLSAQSLSASDIIKMHAIETKRMESAMTGSGMVVEPIR